MLRPIRQALLGLAIAGLLSPIAEAHFLWLVAQPSEKPTEVKLYFSELAAPDDPDLLDRVSKAEAWIPGGRRSEPQRLTFEKKDDALVAKLPGRSASSPVVLKHSYGVLTRGEEPFLLNYYAKSYASKLPGSWQAVNDKELLPLEVIPRMNGSQVSFEVRWQGEPAAGADVTVEGPGIESAIEGTTNDKGVVTCAIPAEGLYSVRARMIENKSGELNGDAYKAVRHYSTLSLPFAPAKLTSAKHAWPGLAQGTTSFGAATVGDWLYVYGGHYGQAHHYSREGQSGDFQRLNLKKPGEWEQLPGGPKRTGLALVAHDGKLYRIGGFSARNADNEDESLWSEPDFARFDPATKKWEDLPSLPEGRSSLDAAVLGDTIYVVGGWEMKAGSETKWHSTAWAMDLSADKPEWKQIAEPTFQRRALSLAAWNDKLYVIGGMQPDGGPTTRVDIYDPQSNKWTEGPWLLGSGMEGFGTSAFAADGRLFVSTISGSIQELAADGSQWQFVGQLDEPRFFHRQIPWKSNELVFVGGASMATGKIEGLERINVAKSPSKKESKQKQPN